MAIWKRVAIGILGALVCSLLGGFLGIVGMASLAFLIALANPQDPSRGSLATVVVATAPVGFIFGMLVGPFIANGLVTDKPVQVPKVVTGTEYKLRPGVVTFWIVNFSIVLALIVGLGLIMLQREYRFNKITAHADMEFQFTVVDSETGSPIPFATILARKDPAAAFGDALAPEFSLSADAKGYASRLVPKCKYHSRHGPFVDTSVIELPDWRFEAVAPGYPVLPLENPGHAYNTLPSYPPLKVVIEIALKKGGL